MTPIVIKKNDFFSHYKGLLDTVKELDKAEIEYELSAGSDLAAVKLGAVFPWEIDHDIQILTANFSLMDADFLMRLRKKGYT